MQPDAAAVRMNAFRAISMTYPGRFALLFAALGVSAGCTTAQLGLPGMGFFVTSTGGGNGADLGGLEGADRLCQRLAAEAGAGDRTWRAYLSVQGSKDVKLVNARDRIGAGPWRNAAGVVIARDVEHLHGSRNNLNKATALDERGRPVSGQLHDILTGTRADGYSPSYLDPDLTCGNWTQSGKAGAALVGHFDGADGKADPWWKSWNSAHQSRDCSQDGLKELGGGGLLYCFAPNG